MPKGYTDSDGNTVATSPSVVSDPAGAGGGGGGRSINGSIRSRSVNGSVRDMENPDYDNDDDVRSVPLSVRSNNNSNNSHRQNNQRYENHNDEEGAPLNVPTDLEVPSSGGYINNYNDKNYNGKDQKLVLLPAGAVVIRKSSIAIFAIFLAAFIATSGYFFFEWWRDDRVFGSNNVDSSRDVGNGSGCGGNGGGDVTQDEQQEQVSCEYTANDIAMLQQQIAALEASLLNLTAEHEDMTDDCENSNGSLTDEINRLQSEIDRLAGENDRLAEQLEEYDALNGRLNASIEELKIQNQILSDSNDEYERLNGQLNATIDDLREQNGILAEQVDRFAELNQGLNATVIDLGIEVDRLEGEVDDLTAQNDRLEGLVGSLNNETQRLWELGNVLQGNVDRLEDHVDELKAENDRLEALVADLSAVASFIDEAAGNLGDTYEQVAAFLAEQITTNRLLVIEALENTYHQRVDNWDCALRDTFIVHGFTSNGNNPIPDEYFQAVIDFVEERVLSDLCLDTNDFLNYLNQRYEGEEITTNRLVTGAQRYTHEALDYYFPESGETGLRPEDWSAAAYECDQLSSDKKFMMA